MGVIKRSDVHSSSGFANKISRMAVTRVSEQIETARISLDINYTKMKYMVTGRDRCRPISVGDEALFDEDLFDVVYRAQLVTSDNDVSR